ncbi:uncharacterized protein LOC110693297 [Chenopodium quinoa]|uniref:uncharacterized protein LOC110693297 n=1 Tax=Chenopodium quinoa TaxID=63459 RepID=UPI000B7816F6|nr:uncharacterized protein LOC110693297 [Chenopodium quinoa]
MTTIRCVTALAACKKLDMHQLDVNDAFLHGELNEEIYMTLPEEMNGLPSKICKLKKSLYGLKQASRQWFARLVVELRKLGFSQSHSDASLFIKRVVGKVIIAAIYMDDIILTGDGVDTISDLKFHLDKIFSIKDLGKLSFFLGIEVSYMPDVTPLPQHQKLATDDGVLLSDVTLYRSLVGKLNFLTNTRPDLSYSVQTLSQFMQNPRTTHMEALQHTLRYVAHTTGQGILLKGSDALTLQALIDSDWASCSDSRKSISGYVLLLGSSPISWKSKKQPTMSKSSSESEYRAMASAAAEVTWVVRLLSELGVLICNLSHFIVTTSLLFI